MVLPLPEPYQKFNVLITCYQHLCKTDLTGMTFGCEETFNVGTGTVPNCFSNAACGWCGCRFNNPQLYSQCRSDNACLT